MAIRPAAIDIGNDSLKAFFGSLTEMVQIPNVIYKASEARQVVELEKTFLEGLHVEITSSALVEGKGFYYVGSLAVTMENSKELGRDAEKSENDQTLILLLTSLAYDAVQNFKDKNGVVEATYALSTGLPLAESKKGKRKQFREKLLSSMHEVRFLVAPENAGITVRIKFEDVLVNVEGHAALFDLTTDDQGRIINEELIKKTVLISDIGGLTTDTAVLYSDGRIDNENSDGTKEGVSRYLDRITKSVEKEFNRKYFKSRRQVVDCITNPDLEWKNCIKINGVRTSIEHIVKEHLTKLASEEYQLIEEVWENVPSIDVAYLIGGGAVILKPYLDEINRSAQNFPLRFVEQGNSLWANARAYFKLLMVYLAQKKSKAEAAASKE